MTNYNDCIGVVTVCYNNPVDLHKTLASVNECCVLPARIIVVDGSMNREVHKVVGSFENLRIEMMRTDHRTCFAPRISSLWPHSMYFLGA